MKKAKKILAIDPGTKHLGFALLEGSALIHYGVKTISDGRTGQFRLVQGRAIVSRLIEDFNPDILFVEKTYFGNNKDSKTLNQLTEQIRRMGLKKGVIVQTIATNSVRKIVCGNGEAGKEDVAKAMVSKYPELRPYLTSDRRWKEEYHRNMFDAVALGLAGCGLVK
ncbi:MAG TPA: crossover junction endodeoxyribonuclease RuvC [Bacteroidota bacterium]|nr:crossover junction endodeoxyribonuclease RuvC [Bacteroidota bacterium]